MSNPTSTAYDELFGTTPPPWISFFDHFTDIYALTSNLPVSASSPWIGTATSTGTFAQTSFKANGSAVLSAAATTDNSGTQIQHDLSTVICDVGKSFEFVCRIQCSEATDSEVFAGLAIADTTLIDGTGTVANLPSTHSASIAFYKADNQTLWTFNVVSGSALIYTLTLPAIVAATYNTLKFRVDMDPVVATKGVIQIWMDNVPYGSVTLTGLPANTVFLTESVAMLSGTASGTITAFLDYVGSRITTA